MHWSRAHSGERAIYRRYAVSWVSYCRIVRAEVLVAGDPGLRRRRTAGGLSHARSSAAHPATIAQAVYAMSDIVLDILAIVTLGYLGLASSRRSDWAA
jgi:peptide/nickel transport system permease protein